MSTLPPELVLVDRDAIWAERERWLPALDAIERRQFDALMLDKRRADWLAGRVAAKRAVQRVFGLPFRAIPIRALDEGPHKGRPVLALDVPGFLSLSHSGSLAAAIWSASPVGIDLERIAARGPSFDAVAFTSEERTRFDALPAAERDDAVTLAWCRKEALAKALGVGLRADFTALADQSATQIRQGILRHADARYAWALA